MAGDLDDHIHAEAVRYRLRDLRNAIESARKHGLTVEVPELVHLYLDGGTASGAPSDWRICRDLKT